MEKYHEKCSICGSSEEGINFKGGYVCEDCVDYIRNLPECNLFDKEACPHFFTSQLHNNPHNAKHNL